jgi:hypothetical protein
MEKLRHHLAVSFRTKVLVPVITVMVLMLALTVWVLDQRITAQFKADGRSDLATADAVFRSVLKLRSRNLLLRFRNLPNEPRYKATLQSGDGRTIRNLLRDLLAEQGVDIVVFRPNDSNSISPDESLFQKRDPLISAGEFEEASDVAVVQALAGEESADTVRVGDRLYDVISIPVLGVGDAQVGALTFGSEIGSAVADQRAGHCIHAPLFRRRRPTAGINQGVIPEKQHERRHQARHKSGSRRRTFLLFCGAFRITPK